MSDEDLRALERAAIDAPSRIRYAEALVRLGRVADAMRALLPAVDDAEVRRRLGRLEAPPVPIEKKPRIVWTARGEGPLPFLELHASPLGLVATTRLSVAIELARGGSGEVSVLDAVTGARRPFAVEGRVVGVYGHVILAHAVVRERAKRQALAAYDLVTGERLWRDEHEATQLGVGIKHVRVACDGVARELAWPYAERPPHEPAPGESDLLPLRAASASVLFETPTVVYGVVEARRPGEETTASIYARARGGAKLKLWSLDLSGARAVAAVGARLYAIRGSEVVCLE